MLLDDQIQKLDQLNEVDLLGFIFYEKSKRFITSATPKLRNTKKVGVFVNETNETILELVRSHFLDFVQLHGNESPEECDELAKYVSVIKAFGIHEKFNFEDLSAYEKSVSYFLFDTQTEQYGGSGKQFRWTLLSKYILSTPFILSGGIKEESLNELLSFQHEKMIGIDMNSGFETEPANKDVDKIELFTKKIKHEN